jgi:hypothetical protein
MIALTLRLAAGYRFAEIAEAPDKICEANAATTGAMEERCCDG